MKNLPQKSRTGMIRGDAKVPPALVQRAQSLARQMDIPIEGLTVLGGTLYVNLKGLDALVAKKCREENLVHVGTSVEELPSDTPNQHRYMGEVRFFDKQGFMEALEKLGGNCSDKQLETLAGIFTLVFRDVGSASPASLKMASMQNPDCADMMGSRRASNRAKRAATGTGLTSIDEMPIEPMQGAQMVDAEVIDEPPPIPDAPQAPPAPPTPNDVPACPECGGPMWDNREQREQDKRDHEAGVRKAQPRPAFKCKDKECPGTIWSASEVAEQSDDDVAVTKEIAIEKATQVRDLLRHISLSPDEQEQVAKRLRAAVKIYAHGGYANILKICEAVEAVAAAESHIGSNVTDPDEIASIKGNFRSLLLEGEYDKVIRMANDAKTEGL